MDTAQHPARAPTQNVRELCQVSHHVLLMKHTGAEEGGASRTTLIIARSIQPVVTLCKQQSLTMHVLLPTEPGNTYCIEALPVLIPQAHSSVKKATMIAGVTHLRVLKTEEAHHWALQAAPLQQAVREDLQEGLIPFYLCATVGTTSTATVDDLRGLSTVSKQHDIW